jgi:enamine deaminase RidA (YjgF/YER057c/UK114 family)
MQRTAVNPWPWSLQFSFSQAERVEGAQRTLYCSGQSAVDANGAPRHAGDMAAQIDLTFDNLEAVLAAGGMSLADVVRLTIYTTDVAGFLAHHDVHARRLKAAGVTPASVLVGVASLAFPDLLIEIEAIAAQ